jgi:dihydrofolate reductase
MSKLIYAANISLDGFLEDETGSFDWSVPDEEVHAFWNEHERHIGTSLYGRRMYEAMRVGEDDDWLTNEPEAVRRLKETSGSDLSIGGAGIAAEAFRHGLVDECVLLLCPVLVGGGKPALPRGVRLDLELLDHRRFGNGVVYVRYAVRHPA